MNRIANHAESGREGRRPYRSELRMARTEATRVRILDATARLMAAGEATVSIPVVAREADVSIPTVYRHFSSKRELLDAVYPHLERRVGLSDLRVPRTLEEFRAGILEVIRRIESLDELGRAVLASPAAEEARAASIERRLAYASRLLASLRPPLPDMDADRIARLIVVLTSSASLRTLRERLGLSIEQTADEIDWIVRVAIDASRRTLH